MDWNGLASEQSLNVSVPGTPRPKGSKDALGRESSKYVKSYMELIRISARESMEQLIEKEPVALLINFYFKRPKSHFGRRLGQEPKLIRHGKKRAPFYHMQKPDVDKLQRSVLDALTGEVFKDDSQVIAVKAFKHWDHKTAATLIQAFKVQ